MRLYATGDTHGGFQRLSPERFPVQRELTREDCVLICGDFGGVWNGEAQDAEKLDWLEERPFTTLFVCGNHENFDELGTYPVEWWNGGKIHRVRPHVLHLMRGQVFQLGGRSFFTMGGARSLDVWDGILEPEEPGFEERYWELRRRHAVFRVHHLDWWAQEMPSEEEYREARRNLALAGNRVDYIVTHCAPDSIQDALSNGQFRRDSLTGFLQEVLEGTEFRCWLFGHYHHNLVIQERFFLLYEQMIQVM